MNLPAAPERITAILKDGTMENHHFLNGEIKLWKITMFNG